MQAQKISSVSVSHRWDGHKVQLGKTQRLCAALYKCAVAVADLDDLDAVVPCSRRQS